MKIIQSICFGLLITILASCEDYLAPKITNEYGDDVTWKIGDYALGTLAGAYAGINQNVCGYNGNNYLDAITDNSLTTQTASAFYYYVFGSQSAFSDPISIWGTAYNCIAIANLFLEKGLSPDIIFDIATPANDQMIRDRSKGEAYFLRAWWQMELLRNYGGLSDDGRALGYVIVTRTFDEDERETINALPRGDFETCVQQIFADCDTAFIYLPLQYNNNVNDNADLPFGANNLGRASGKASLALKSRVALLAASPAYQPQGAYALSEDSIRQKWLRAANIALEALTLGEMGGLNNMVAMNNDMIVGNQVNTPAHASSYAEMLFYRFANQNVHEQNHYPPMWFGAGKCNPSQNLVNAYPMANGYPITDQRSGYDPQNPYAGRDARFTQQINYNGGKFCEIATERELAIYSSAADGTIGCDAPGYDYRNTWTGYYIRKGLSDKQNINYNPDNPGATQNDYHRNPLLRRTEVWMNLAEALNEYAGPTAVLINDPAANTPVDIIKRLRTLYRTDNAYVDEVALTGKEAFRNLILNERRIEFAFENMRLWDIRRWKMPQLSEPVYGISIYKDADNKYVYSGTDPGVDDIVVQDRSMLSDDRYYTSPVPYNEIVKNPNLVQNAGWK